MSLADYYQNRYRKKGRVANLNVSSPSPSTAIPKFNQKTKATQTTNRMLDQIAPAQQMWQQQFDTMWQAQKDFFKDQAAYRAEQNRLQRESTERISSGRNLTEIATTDRRARASELGSLQLPKVADITGRWNERTAGTRGRYGVKQAQVGADAQRDIAQSNLQGTKYTADQRLAGVSLQTDAQKYTSDQQLRGTGLEVQGRKDIAQMQGLTQRDIAKTQKSQAMWTQGIRSVGDYLSAREQARAQNRSDESRLYQSFLQSYNPNFRYWN